MLLFKPGLWLRIGIEKGLWLDYCKVVILYMIYSVMECLRMYSNEASLIVTYSLLLNVLPLRNSDIEIFDTLKV